MINYLFSQLQIVMRNNSLKELHAPIVTSWDFPAELGNIRALPESPRSCDCHILIIK